MQIAQPILMAARCPASTYGYFFYICLIPNAVLLKIPEEEEEELPDTLHPP